MTSFQIRVGETGGVHHVGHAVYYRLDRCCRTQPTRNHYRVHISRILKRSRSASDARCSTSPLVTGEKGSREPTGWALAGFKFVMHRGGHTFQIRASPLLTNVLPGVKRIAVPSRNCKRIALLRVFLANGIYDFPG